MVDNNNQVLQLVVPAKAEYLSLVRLVVSHIAKDMGFTDESIADLRVAISEASSNVVRHAYNDQVMNPDCIIEIACYKSAGCLQVAVVDHGCGMPIPPPPSEGLGFGIIGSLMDKVDVETGAKGTTVLLEKDPAQSRR